jgi:hypothetical protein
MTNEKLNKLTDQQKAATDAGVQYALQVMSNLPKSNELELEAHIAGVLIVFWAAMWGTFGKEYANDFIHAQLQSMQDDNKIEQFYAPKIH